MVNPLPEPDFTEAGRKLFAGPCDFFYAAARSDGLPPVGAPEVAFAGRSNVGKSSLIMKRAGVKIELFDNLRKLFQRAPPAVAPK